MNWRFWATKQASSISLETLIARLEDNLGTTSKIPITPDLAMESPTVHAIVNAVARRLAVSPVQVFRRTMSDGRVTRELLPRHGVARLMRKPNSWQSSKDYWLDAVSGFMRFGAYFAFKSRAVTGPVQQLIPLHGDTVTVKQRDDFSLVFTHMQADGRPVEYTQERIHYVRGPSRDYVTPDSPVMAVRESIALELAAEQFAAGFFGNGALPGVVFKLQQGFQGFKTDEDKAEFKKAFDEAYTGKSRFQAMVLPKGMDADFVGVDQEKAQFIETRKMIRTVIAGAFGVPPHLVGDLERATFNNVEQQDADFTNNVVLPIAQVFEAAMERDLLAETDRVPGSDIIIRFDLDAVQRTDFKSRQEALRQQREWGIITPNEWREMEGKNPLRAEDGGDTLLRPMNMTISTNEEPEEAEADGAGENPFDDQDEGEENAA